MRPTRPRLLVATFVVAGVACYGLLLGFYADLPPLRRTWSASLFVLAAAEFFLAPATRARIAGRPRTRPIMPIVVARTAALARASSAVGAAVGGGWLAALLFTTANRPRFRTAGADAITAAIGFAGALLLIVAALLLERACRVPRPPSAGTGDPAAGPPRSSPQT
ncbi:MAG: DUF3180 domain-containing protein [Frankia sp.]|nr:DUF3180 domain-containing protein [Frankia sp.]